MKKADLWLCNHFCKVLEKIVLMCNLCKRVVIELLWVVNNVIFHIISCLLPWMGHKITFCAYQVLGRALCQGERLGSPKRTREVFDCLFSRCHNIG